VIDLYAMGEELAKLRAENEALRKSETAAISWVDGVIEILELYQPETNSQIEWKKHMVAEAYRIIQAHVDAAMKGQT